MITTKTGDMIHDAPSGYSVHGCNCQGKMGSGIAAVVRKVWPLAYEVYKDKYDEGYNNVLGQHVKGIELGSIIDVQVDEDIVIINAMTQAFYKGHPQMPNSDRYVDYEAVAAAFEGLNALINSDEYPDTPRIVHFPLIGAGLGGGNWNIIEKIIDETLDDDIEKVLWVLP